MKNKLIIGLLLIITACNNNHDVSKLEKMSWILGEWKNTTSEGATYEIWNKINDSLYIGESFMLVNKDTVFSESISLKQSETVLFYIPSVRNQNSGAPITFKLTSDHNNQFVFENPEHDYPNRIIYSNPHPDTLRTVVEGKEEWKERKEELVLIRQK